LLSHDPLDPIGMRFVYSGVRVNLVQIPDIAEEVCKSAAANIGRLRIRIDPTTMFDVEDSDFGVACTADKSSIV